MWNIYYVDKRMVRSLNTRNAYQSRFYILSIRLALSSHCRHAVLLALLYFNTIVASTFQDDTLVDVEDLEGPVG